MTSLYKIAIEGRNPDYFFKELIKKKVNIFSVEKGPRKVLIVTDEEGLKSIKQIKTSYKYYIVNYYGMAKVKYYLKHSYIFIICFLLGVLLNIFLSKVIFKVEVIHTNSYIRSLVYNDLKDYGIEKFHFKVSFQEKEKIVEEILKKENNDLEWLEIEEIGTKYVVRVEQRKKNTEVRDCPIRNIVAKKDAMILEIRAEEGEVVKKKYDYVKKGDIIISGAIYNKEEIMAKRCARGEVYGEIWYKVSLEVPKKYREEVVTGKEKRQLEITFLNKHYTLFHNFLNYKREEIPLISSRILPFRISFTKYLETNIISKNYTLENIDREAEEMAVEKLYTKYGKLDIEDKKVLKKYEKDSKIIVEVFIKVRENITDYADIVDLE